MSENPPGQPGQSAPQGQPGPQDQPFQQGQQAWQHQGWQQGQSVPQGQQQGWQQPGGPQQPSGPFAPAPQQPGAFGRALQAVTGRDWLAAVLAAVSGWVAAYVVAGLSLLLTVALLASGGSGSSTPSTGPGSAPDLGGTTPDIESLLSGVSVLLGAPAQLVALADLGRLHLSGSIGLLGSGSGALAVVPALVLTAQVVLAVVLTRRIRTRALGRPQVLLTAVVSGLVTTVLTNGAAGLFAIRFPSVAGAAIEPVHAVGVGSVLGAFIIGALATALARPSALVGGNLLAARLLGTLRIAASQLTLVVVPVALVVVVAALVAQPEYGAALPLLLGNVAVALTALGFLGGVGTSGLGSVSDTASVFGGAGGWTWLVVLLVVVTSVAAGLALAVRRNDRVRTTLDWVVTPLVWFAFGLLLFVLGTGIVSYRVDGVSSTAGAGSVGVAPWTPLVFALWGGAIEVVARFLAPVLLPRLGATVVLRTSRLVGADPRPVAPTVFPGAPATFPGAPATASPAAAAAGQAPAFPAGSAPASPTGPSGPTEQVPPTDGHWTGTPGAAAQQPSAQPGAGQPGTAQPGYGAQPGAAQPGYPQPLYLAQPAHPFIGGGAPAPAPMSPKAKRILVRSLIAGGAVVVVVIAGAVTTSVLRANVWGPAPTVKSYVQAIASGDADTAADLSEVPSDAAMLDSTVLESAEDRPSDIRVGRVQRSGDNAIATLSYTQDGENRSGQVTLRRTGTAFLVKDEWRVTQPLAQTVTLTATDVLEGAPVTIGGKEIGEITDGKFTSLAYPGTYEITVGGTKYFTGGTQELAVGAATSGYVDFSPKATKALQQDAEQYVDDLLEECAAQTDISALSDCPWYGPYDAEGSVRYDVTTKPELEVEATGSGTVLVTSTRDGAVAYDYTSYTGDRKRGEDTFVVNEYLKVEDGKLVPGY